MHIYIHHDIVHVMSMHHACSVYTLQTDNDQCIVVQICRHVADIVITLVFDHFWLCAFSCQCLYNVCPLASCSVLLTSVIMLHWNALHPHLQPHLGKVPSSHDCCCCCYCCSNTWCHSVLQTVLPPLHPTTQIEQWKAPHANYSITHYILSLPYCLL